MSVLTCPFGTQNIYRLHTSTTKVFCGFILQRTIGGAKVASAGTPLKPGQMASLVEMVGFQREEDQCNTRLPTHFAQRYQRNRSTKLKTQ